MSIYKSVRVLVSELIGVIFRKYQSVQGRLLQTSNSVHSLKCGIMHISQIRDYSHKYVHLC